MGSVPPTNPLPPPRLPPGYASARRETTDELLARLRLERVREQRRLTDQRNRDGGFLDWLFDNALLVLVICLFIYLVFGR